MRKYLFSSPRVLLLGVLAALFSAVPAQAALTRQVNSSECREGSFSQVFTAFKDNNWYTLAPGQSQEGFDGQGWVLSGGAKIVTGLLPDGSRGNVLDLPSGATAVSPITCITSDYPTARMFVRNVAGAEGVNFQVAYEGTHTWEKPKNTGQVHGANNADWGLSGNVNLQPEKSFVGWQPMRMVLTGNGKTSEFQVSDLYLDPRLTH